MMNYFEKIISKFVKLLAKIITYLSKVTQQIIQKENLKISKEVLLSIQDMFKSDIRSMINFLQSNHTFEANLIKNNIITCHVWEDLITLFKKERIEKILDFITLRSTFYNIEINTFLIKFIYYLFQFFL